MEYQAAAFTHVDHLANTALSREAFARYLAYRYSLMKEGEEAGAILTILSTYVWGLVERGPGTPVH
jgi:hypothetical protein